MKIVKWSAAILLVGLAIIGYINYPKLHIISGFSAKNMASTVFIAGRDAEGVAKVDHNVPLIRLAEASVDSTGKYAVASVYGLVDRKAVYRKGLGSVLLPDGQEFAGDLPIPERLIQNDIYDPFSENLRDTLFPEIDYMKLEKAVAGAFVQSGKQKTRSVLVLYKDRILAEQYSGDIGPRTPVLGWSMTKSVLATLYGILEYQEKIDLCKKAGVKTWDSDSRSDITYNNLLRMQSGLAWEEDYSEISDVTRMLFMEADMSAVQADKQSLGPPGTIWNYSSGTSNLLSGLLRNQFQTYQEYLNFPYRELIDRIGMHSMLLETDMAGNFVGSSYGWATTRDWARFGLLYLNNGQWGEDRLFGSAWIEYITTPTPGSNGSYGAHFWLNSTETYPGVARDLYSCNGYQGQYVFIIPSLDLVIVRTGLAEPPDFNATQFLKEVTSAVRREGK